MALSFQDIKTAQTQPGFNLASASQAATLPYPTQTPIPQTTIPQTPATQPAPGQSAYVPNQQQQQQQFQPLQQQPQQQQPTGLQMPVQPPVQNAIGTRQIPGQQQTEYFNAQTGQGFSNPQALSSFLNQNYNAQTNSQNVFQYLTKAFEQAKGTAPDTQGEAQAQIQKTLDGQNAGAGDLFKASQIDQQLQNNPAYQQLLADKAQYDSLANQNQSLVQTYQQMSAQLGIPALNTELINMKNVIDGTEQDIRNEVTAAQGFSTESQVMALANSRNKQLVKNYNNLLATKEQAMSTLNQMTSLASQDRQFAMSSLNQKIQLDKQIYDVQVKMTDAAKEAYNNVIKAVGYGGLYNSLKNDPQSLALAEKTLGLSSGQLSKMASTSTQEWSAPYSLGGDIVQKNNKTGEIRTAVNVAAGRASSKDVGYDASGKKYNVASASSEIRDLWKQGYIQGNGKISSTDYQKAKAWWVQQGLSESSFDSQFSDLIDKSGKTWKVDYGYKGN